MALVVAKIPEDLMDKSAKFYSRHDNEECKELLQRLVENVRNEQTGRAIIDTIIMAELSPSRFFDVLRAHWNDDDKRTLTLHSTKMMASFPVEAWELHEEGFAGLDEKLVCTGCGGVVLEIPKFCTMTMVHAWLNPCCPAFLGEEPDSIRGMELTEWPECNHPVVKERLEKLNKSTYIHYDGRYVDTEKRTETWFDNEDLIPRGEPEKFVEAGWYVEKHPAGLSIQCFCCGIEKRVWRKDECPMMAHLLESPCCPYMHAVMDEDDIKAVFAGHGGEVKLHHLDSVAAHSYFQEIWFTPFMVSCERIKWNQKSTHLQKETDSIKSRLLAEWLIDQRIKAYDYTMTPKKRKVEMDRKMLMRNYNWQTSRVDVTTRAVTPPCGRFLPFHYMPNWKREDRYVRQWGLGVPGNRGALLTQGDWLILEQ